MTTSAITATIHRLRRRYRELFRQEISETVAEPGNVESEIRHLLTILSQ